MKTEVISVLAALAIAALVGACSSATSAKKTTSTSTGSTSSLTKALTINNFESDSSGTTYDTYGYSDTSFSATATNPSTGASNGDTSSKAIFVQPTGYDAIPKFTVTLPSGTHLSDFGWVHVKLLAFNNGGSSNNDNAYKNLLAFAGSTLTSSGGAKNTNATFIGQSAQTGGASDTAWNEYIIPIDPTVAASITDATLQLAVGISRAAIINSTDGYYLDDVSLLPKAKSAATFESDSNGTTYDTYGYSDTSFSATAANPSTAAANGDTSSKAIFVQPTGYDAVPKFTLTLPSGTHLSDFGWVHVKFLALDNGGSADNAYKNLLAFAGTTLTSSGGAKNTNASYIGQSAQTGGASDTAWNEYIIPIDPTVASGIADTTLQLAVGISRQAIENSTDGYYLDDVGLIAK